MQNHVQWIHHRHERYMHLIFDVRGGWMTWASLCQRYVLNKKGTSHCDRLGLHFWPDSWLQGHIQEPVLRAVLWSSCPASACGAAVSESWRETGFLYQHLQRPRHPREPASGLSQKHMAKVSGKRSGDFVFLSTVKRGNVKCFQCLYIWSVVFQFFNYVSYFIGGEVFTLQDIENGVLRGNRKGVAQLMKPFSRNDPRLQVSQKEDIPLWVYII